MKEKLVCAVLFWAGMGLIGWGGSESMTAAIVTLFGCALVCFASLFYSVLERSKR